MKRSTTCLALATLLGTACYSPDSQVQSTSSAVDSTQCIYFESTGKDTICHATGSATNPFVIVKVSESACIQAHSQHPNDYIDVNGGSCNGQGCLPVNAPCDATLPCCDSFVCKTGYCTDLCAGVTCPSDECNSAGTCDPHPRTCSPEGPKP